MPLTTADRRWILRQLAKLRQEVRDDTALTLTNVLNEEAQLLFLHAFKQQERGPES